MDKQVEIIISLYEKQLEIPEKGVLPIFILCPVGLVGAGKTTVVKPLAKAFSLLRISNDEIRELCIGQNITHTQEQIHEVFYYLAKKYLTLGYGVAVDANCSSKKELLGKAAETFGIPLVWIHINPPEEFIINKLRNYNGDSNLFKNDDAVEHYRRSKEERVELDKNIPFIYTFDTSKEDLPLQIAESIEKIKDTLKTSKL
jgi:predicted kinase